MRVVVLGGAGMLGHTLVRTLARAHDVEATIRDASVPSALTALRDPQATRHARTSAGSDTVDGGTVDGGTVDGGTVGDDTEGDGDGTAGSGTIGWTTSLDVRDMPHVEQLLDRVQPDAVINATGIVKQRAEADAASFIEINALVPHKLAAACRRRGARLLQISTDCVFSGTRGGYAETDTPDATDLYGQTKRLGEVAGPGAITLRTSMIGLELRAPHGLIEWFLAQPGEVTGFRRAIFSGLTTAALADLIARLLTAHPRLDGLWHVAAEPISKYDLLQALAARLPPALARTVRPDETFTCDRSLRGDAFRAATGWVAPSWDYMLDELAHAIAHRWTTGAR